MSKTRKEACRPLRLPVVEEDRVRPSPVSAPAPMPVPEPMPAPALEPDVAAPAPAFELDLPPEPEMGQLPPLPAGLEESGPIATPMPTGPVDAYEPPVTRLTGDPMPS